MVRYDPYTDSFIDNSTKEVTATNNLDALSKPIIQRNVVEVTDASIEKIADAVVRKLADRKDEPTISKMEQVDKDINVRSKDEPQTHTVDLGNGFSITANDCDTCKHRDKPFDDLPCDMCCKAHSGYEPKDEPQTNKGVSYSDHTDYDEPKTYVTWTEPADCPWK